MTSQMTPLLGIIGAGRLGTAVARQALRAGYSVQLANSRGPASLALPLSVLLPGAKAAELTELARTSDLIVLALPLHAYRSMSPELLAGKVVIDAMNYWSPTEGRIEEFVGSHSSSEYLQTYFSKSRLVKTLNHIAYHELEEDALPADAVNRRGLALAGDDLSAKQLVSQLINELGFEAVDLGPLARGVLFEPDTPLFNTRLSAAQIRTLTATTPS